MSQTTNLPKAHQLEIQVVNIPKSENGVGFGLTTSTNAIVSCALTTYQVGGLRRARMSLGTFAFLRFLEQNDPATRTETKTQPIKLASCLKNFGVEPIDFNRCKKKMSDDVIYREIFFVVRNLSNDRTDW